MSDLAEEAVEFATPIDLEGRGRFRRIAGIGPAYEVLQDKGEFVRVRVIHDGVEFDYRKAGTELDPLA